MTEKPKAVVLVNPVSGGGRGAGRWRAVQAAANAAYLCEFIETDGDAPQRLAAEIRAGTRALIAAGGDGTVHLAVNTLMAARGELPLSDFTLGAIGLGSSNDFHKPYGRQAKGVPLKLGWARRSPRDLGLARITGADGSRVDRVFAVSASIGLVAEANDFFNSRGGLLNALKSNWTGGAILYSALRTIARYRNRRVRLTGLDLDFETELTSFHVMKTPFLSGSFRFDGPLEPASRQFSIQLMEKMSRAETIRTLVDLASGRFTRGGRDPKRRSWKAPRWAVETDGELPLELDGELYRFRKVEFEIHPEQILQCDSE